MSNTWSTYIIKAHDDMIKSNDNRELGKIRAIAAEYVAMDWINEKSGINVELGSNGHYSDKNGSSFDLFSLENNTRIQVKYRGDKFHLETTRRLSDKNKGSQSKTGHVAYRIDECDIFVFVVPSPNSTNPMDSQFYAIPSKDLEDPKNPGCCIVNIPKKKVLSYKDKTIDILKDTKNK